MIVPPVPGATFGVPPYGYGFDSRILTRSLALIDRGIWGGLKPVRLKRWLKNFETDEERYLAACVLDALIYRSDDQTTALLLHLFQHSLIDLTRRTPTALGPIEDWLSTLRASRSGIRLVAAVKQSDPPHKSAHLISRLMKRQLSVRPQWIAKPWELRQHMLTGAKVLVFIDDFLGSGKQFEELLKQERLEWLFSVATVIYAPFVAHVEGIAYLEKIYPLLRISAAEVLDQKHQLFHPSCSSFRDDRNSPEGAEAFYYEFLIRKGIPLSSADRLGFGGLGLTYVFEHAVPDNNLPILWWPGNGNWAPLFDR